MPSPPVTTQYAPEKSTSSSRPSVAHRRTTSAQKVSGWLENTSTSSSNPIGYPLSPSSSPDGKKMVHWTGDVEDNEKAPRRSSPTTTSKPSTTSRSGSSSSKSSSSKSSSSSSKRKSTSSSKDDSRSRAPPPTPRFHRLPTPELSDMECGDFCDCCQTREQKMNAQLDAAQAHILAAKQRGY